MAEAVVFGEIGGDGPGGEGVVIKGDLLEAGEAREEVGREGGEGVGVDVELLKGGHAGEGGQGPRDLVALEVEGLERGELIEGGGEAAGEGFLSEVEGRDLAGGAADPRPIAEIGGGLPVGGDVGKGLCQIRHGIAVSGVRFAAAAGSSSGISRRQEEDEKKKKKKGLKWKWEAFSLPHPHPHSHSHWEKGKRERKRARKETPSSSSF